MCMAAGLGVVAVDYKALLVQMLSETVVHECIVRLLRSSTDEKSLEGLALLIATTGKNLDIEKAKVCPST